MYPECLGLVSSNRFRTDTPSDRYTDCGLFEVQLFLAPAAPAKVRVLFGCIPLVSRWWCLSLSNTAIGVTAKRPTGEMAYQRSYACGFQSQTRCIYPSYFLMFIGFLTSSFPLVQKCFSLCPRSRPWPAKSKALVVS